MTRVWNNGNNHQDKQNGTFNPEDLSETKFNLKENRNGMGANNGKEAKYYQNGKSLDDDEDTTDSEPKKTKKGFFHLCCSETLEKDLAEQSKTMLNMIYFFQILPFYILQFTSGMALGKN